MSLSLISWSQAFGEPRRLTDLRLDRALWGVLRHWIFDFSEGEPAGVLLVRGDPIGDGAVLVGERFLPVTEPFVRDLSHGLRYDASFNLRVAEIAEREGLGAVLVHAHGFEEPPLPSRIDATFGVAFLAFMRRRQPKQVHGLLVLGESSVTGICETPREHRAVRGVVAAGIPTLNIRHQALDAGEADETDRQLLAIGRAGQDALAGATVGLVGVSGGGSHVAQQLIHAGVGTLIAVDDDTLDQHNLRRVVGAVLDDVDRTKKVQIPVRLAASVRPEVEVVPIETKFPSTESIEKLRQADVLIGCVDSWDVRDALNEFALQYRIPYVDIGMLISAAGPGEAVRASGQITLVAPDGPCLRCMGLVTDARVLASLALRQGYVDGVNAPQVVSFNGALASEAVTTVLMLLAGDDRLERNRRYAYPPGKITVVDAKRGEHCPACLAAHLERGVTAEGRP